MKPENIQLPMVLMGLELSEGKLLPCPRYCKAQ
nr:hypothetical protein Q903MT_gene5368 [Picea sitchensis]